MVNALLPIKVFFHKSIPFYFDMKKQFVISCFALLTSLNIFAQNTNNVFEIALPEVKIKNSLYHTLNVLDSRLDTTHFGIVQLGAFNRKTEVKISTPIEAQLQKAFHHQLDSAAQNGKLLFQIRQFYFAEITSAFSEKGYCYLKADLYTNNNGNYKRLARIDTVAIVSAMDVTKLLMRQSSKLITDFIAISATQKPVDGESYTFADIMKIDDIEKSKIKLYTTDNLVDGVYQTYSDFKLQQPNSNDFTVSKHQEPKVFIEKEGKKQQLKPKEIYAFVKEGKAYIATEYGYYPLTKRDNNFYFNGKIKVTADNASVMSASLFFGLIGGLIASMPNAQTSELKIDHQTGEFIREKTTAK